MATAELSSVAELIDRLGGASAVARALGKGVSVVSEMKRQNAIAVRHWDDFIVLANASGVPFDAVAMLRLHARPTALINTGTPAVHGDGGHMIAPPLPDASAAREQGERAVNGGAA